MAKKFYRNGNYFYIEDTATNQKQVSFVEDAFIWEHKSEIPSYNVRGTNIPAQIIPFSQIVDVNGVAFADETAFKSFYENFNSGGGSPQILYAEEGTNEDGAMHQKASSETFEDIRASILGISGVQDVATSKIANDIKVISNGFDYSFDDRAGYTSWQPLTYSAGTTKGIRIVSTGGANFINTGKFIDNSIGVITLTCKTVNASSIFGFGVKNGSTFEGATWYGSNGRFVMQDYNSTAEKTGTSSVMTVQPTYGIGNVLSIRMIFAGSQTYLQTIKDGVEGELVKPTASNPILSGGELVLMIKGAITLDDYYINIERNENPNFYVSPTGLDTNNGTYNSPFSTIKKAKKLAKNYGNIILKHGDYLNQSFDLAGGIKILEDVKGTARLIYGTRFTSASFTSGSTKVYEVNYAPTLTAGYVLWQHDLNDPLSLIIQSEMHPLQRGLSHRLPSLKCTWLGSVALLEASDPTRSYFFWSAGKLYFTIASGSNLTTNPIVIPDNTYIKNGANIVAEDYCNVRMKGITIMYRGLDLSGTTPNISELTLLCSGGAYGIQPGNAVDFNIKRCRVGGINYNAANGGDAFNLSNPTPITPTSKIATGVFMDVWGHDCEDDGITCHGYAEGTILSSLFEYNGNGISTASGGHFSLNGTISRRNGTNMSTGGVVSDGGVGSSIYAKNCTFENQTGVNQVTGASGNNVIVLDQCLAIGTNFATASASFIQKACVHSAT